MRLLLFSVDNIRYGIAADRVIEIVRAVTVTPLPTTAAVVEGIIIVRGLPVAVFDLRLRFSGRASVVQLAHQFVLVDAGRRTAALHVDSVLDLAEVLDASITDPRAQASSVRHVDGVALLDDGVVLIHDVETFLCESEADTLDRALAALADGGVAPASAAR
jgi:purine-binding chemotaxis protein CheW